jgi:hypothetical protein
MVAMEKSATDGTNWPLWQATMLSFFESRNLMKHINGTAIKPPIPTAFPAHYTPSDEEEAVGYICYIPARQAKYIAEKQEQTREKSTLCSSIFLLFFLIFSMLLFRFYCILTTQPAQF